MKIAIVGASGAGLPLSTFLKKKHPEWSVLVLEQNAKIGKKLLATGNGHCNLLNKTAKPEDYSDPSFVSPFFTQYTYQTLLSFLHSVGVATMEIGDMVYPKSFSSSGYVETIRMEAEKLGVKFLLNCRVSDYKKTAKGLLLLTNCGEMVFDKIVFCTGGKSGRNLGSDGSLFPVFEQHGYSLAEPIPGLSPIKTKENVSSLAGLRHEASVSLLDDEKFLLNQEVGEVLFKKDGLSGIVIFNTQRIAAANKHPDALQISLDLFPLQSEQNLAQEIFDLKKANSDFISSFMNPALARYCLKSAHLESLSTLNDVRRFSRTLKNLVFHIAEFYPFEDSQVTVGGIDTSELKTNFESRMEPGVYFAGEVLNVDGPCGGFNLEWCLISALALVEQL